ncbi:DUF6171 family protein [Marinobacterium lutimaris]|uniref:Uncharacterized protein n=1 Tax=Marinobacterium lutimaris TaxID=568106 RepID=A0A1H5XRV7_9GAMM|nr:DUF6171 family protein [Marinobacterium lutimaris]SEG14519.1 hypothetical protein SAMN05444390_1011484 [Marinobacterium lutimaris]
MGMIKLTPEEALVQRARISLCEECDLTPRRRCPDCGCFMDLKTRIMGAKCPRGEWVAMSKTEVIEFAYSTAVALETD